MSRGISLAAYAALLCHADAIYYRTFREYLGGLTTGCVGSCARSNLNLWCFWLVVLVLASTHVTTRLIPEESRFAKRMISILAALGLGLIGVHVVLTFF